MPRYNLSKVVRVSKPVHWLLIVAIVLVVYRWTQSTSVGQYDMNLPNVTEEDYRLNDDNSEHSFEDSQQQILNDVFWKDDITPEFLAKLDKKTHKCPEYVDYCQEKHPPFSQGKFKYPYMRPAPKCRTFTSQALEKLITDLKSKIKDPDLARLIENTLPNTLDTTILWHKPSGSGNGASHHAQLPETFVVTGDIHAEWLRDSARQLSVFQPLIKYDQPLKDLIKGAIRTQEQYVISSPYCNAFHPPPGSGVKRGNTAMDLVYPVPNWKLVFECKYEIDSLASFLTLTNDYVENSDGDLSVITKYWLAAYEKILIVLKRESQPLFNLEDGRALPFYYTFQRQTNIGSETLPLGGVGNPVNFNTGLVRSAFRPSDDATILQFFIPGNAHMLVELRRTMKNILQNDSIQLDLKRHIKYTEDFIKDIEEGIEKYGIIEHPIWGRVYAYEVDGYGGSIFMDDANVPSLLSLPDIGYLDASDEIYQNTRKMILSKDGNPYFLKGVHFLGIGGPHIGIMNAWPMSLLMRIRTTDNDEEIQTNLKQVMETTAGLGLMHESVNVDSARGKDYTRPWFAWCNSEFGRTILHLAKHKPHLIFKEEYHSTPYAIESLFAS
ncbi:CIC11C00000001714 [Sungouiella intermedia]|uniref:CIC11C00000001714 n=1 Tax=Sungouiella intermedia TaxID=45354 RepID=A0A1L0BW48_9ASCO|nr:CIC11C00000001714 [[Candida] intermedia]